MIFKDINLLVISNYTSKDGFQNANFVKEQVDVLKSYFNKIIVISPTHYFPEFLTNFDFIPKFYKNKTRFYNYKYDNVEVYYPKFFTLPLDPFRKRNGDFAYNAAIRTIYKNNLNFDLIHSHFTYRSGYVGMKIKIKYNKKAVLTIHENREWFINEYFSQNPKIYETWKKHDILIRVNKKDIPYLKNYNPNTINIPNGFDKSKFHYKNISVKNKLQIPHNKDILLNVGSYKIHHKNQINLIKAINELIKYNEDILLYLIGSGADRNQIEETIEKYNLEKYINVMGYEPHEKIPLWMNAADLFVLPSYSESFGIVNIESLACGTPVVSTINGGSEEIIISKDYGFLLENPDNYKKLAALIKKGLNKNWDTDKILSYAQNYEWKNIITNLLTQYENLLDY